MLASYYAHPNNLPFDIDDGDGYLVLPFETVTFDDIMARFVKFTAIDYYGTYIPGTNNYRAGLGEIRIYGADVPEPATWVMLLLGAGAVIAIRRKK